MRSFPAVPFFVQALIGMFLGCVVGAAFGTKALVFAPVAALIIDVVRAVAVPLLFFAVVDGLTDPVLRGRSIRKLVLVCVTNALAACALALTLVHFVDLRKWTSPLVRALSTDMAGAGDVAAGAAIPETASWSAIAASFVPRSIVQPFLENNIPAVVVLGVLLGLAVRELMRSQPAVDDEGSRELEARTILGSQIRAGARAGLTISMTILHLLVRLLPIAVFAAVARAVGEHGLAIFAGLGAFLALCMTGLAAHMLVVYSAWMVRSGVPLRTFWRAAREPVTYAFGVNSSLVTLPLTLKQLRALGVSDSSARLGACVGTNFNNDGILLYQVTAALVFAQALGLDWSIGKQVLVAAIAVFSTLGVSGFPDAGIVALAIVLPLAGLPSELIALILPVDWILARMRSAVNVAGDMAVAVAVDAPSSNRTKDLEGKVTKF